MIITASVLFMTEAVFFCEKYGIINVYLHFRIISMSDDL